MRRRGSAFVSIGLLLALLGCSDSGGETGTDGGQPPADVVGGEDAGGGPDVTAEPTALQAPVEIIVDTEGVPHVYAEDDWDLMFAAGYVVASERLFLLDMNRRRAAGRTSEVLGETGVYTDKLTRTFGFARLGPLYGAALEESRPDVARLLRAYVAGLNRYVAEVEAGTVPLPPEYGPDGLDFAPEPFTESEILSVGVMAVFGFSSMIEFEIIASILQNMMPADFPLFPGYSPGASIYTTVDAYGTKSARADAPAGDRRKKAAAPMQASEETLREVAAGLARWRDAFGQRGGSNNWVVNRRLTDNGRTILAGDPHLVYGAPNDLFAQHLNSADAGGSFDVVGFSLPGIPGVQLGHNARLAWAATVNFADAADVWDVKVTDVGAHLGGEVVPVVPVDETIRVRLPDGSFADEPFEVQTVPGYGVILPPAVLPAPSILFARGSVLVNWTGFTPSPELALYSDFDRAGDLESFEHAVELQRTGMMNWIGATADGFLYRVNGNVPDRGPRGERPVATLVLDGDDPETLWDGTFLTAEQMPRATDERDRVVTANNDPWGHSADNDPTNDEFYYGGYYLPGYRAHRIAQRLDEMIAAGPVTAEDMQALQHDTHSVLADQLLPYLADALAVVDTDESLAVYRDRADIRDAARWLLDWDRKMVRSSGEAALFRMWFAYVGRRTLGDEMTLIFEPMEAAQPIILAKFVMNTLHDDLPVFIDTSRSDILLGALADVIDEWTARGGRDYTWGDLQRCVFPAPDGSVPYYEAKDGGGSAVDVTQCYLWSEGALAEHCETTVGALYRAVYTFDEDGTPRATFNHPHGNGGQEDDWREGRYRPLYFKRAEVEANAARRWTLEP